MRSIRSKARNHRAAGPQSPQATTPPAVNMADDKPLLKNFHRARADPTSEPTPGSPSREDSKTYSGAAAPARRTSFSSTTTSSRSARSSFSQEAAPFSDSPPSPHVSRRLVVEGTFLITEICASEYDNINAQYGDEIIRPDQYEDAASECETRMEKEMIDPRLVQGMEDLVFDDDDDRDAWVKRMRDEKKARRRTSSIVQKRKLSESIGSSDEEDLQPVQLSAHEAGSSARRLRRKVRERTSLVFDDPPPDIPELEEPESCEEMVEDDDGAEGQSVHRHLPFYIQVMDVDSETD